MSSSVETSHVIVIAVLLIAVGEIAGIASIIAPNSGIGWNILWIGILTSGGVWFWRKMYESPLTWTDLVQRTRNRQLTWLYLHWTYIAIGLINPLILLISFLALTLPRPIVVSRIESGLFFDGSTVLLITFYAFFVLQLLGQRYEGLSGISFAGVSSLANISERIFSKHSKAGLQYLRESLTMMNVLYSSRQYGPAQLDTLLYTVLLLRDVEVLPYSHLEALCHSLSALPTPDNLPTSIGAFLGALSWPKGFREKKKKCSNRLRYVLTSIVGVLGFLFTLFQDQARNFFTALFSQISTDPSLLLAILVSGVALFLPQLATTYIVGILDIRSYGRVLGQEIVLKTSQEANGPAKGIKLVSL